MSETIEHKSGYIGILGRPNVGKSTLLNRIIGQKISITTHKPQTTRHQILGIKTTDHAQYIYVDTPGFHTGAKKAINKYMNKAALQSIADVDVILWVVESLKFKEEDELLLEKISQATVPIIVAVNKADLINDKNQLLPFIQTLSEKHDFTALIPVSAETGEGVVQLEELLTEHLIDGPAYFEDSQVTDKSVRFITAERIREALFLQLQDELPYSLTVEIESFAEEPEITNIAAVIWVERTSQKGIVIGKQGERLKKVGKRARLSMESFLQKKVFLKLWVKVRDDWADDERALKSLGYRDE